MWMVLGLYLLTSDGGVDCAVTTDEAVADAQWAPAPPTQFVAIHGRMPANATLYNHKV